MSAGRSALWYWNVRAHCGRGLELQQYYDRPPCVREACVRARCVVARC